MYELRGWFHYAMKAKYLVKLLYMAIYIAETAIMPPPSFFLCVLFENSIYIFINLTIFRYCIGRQSHRQQLFPRE